LVKLEHRRTDNETSSGYRRHHEPGGCADRRKRICAECSASAEPNASTPVIANPKVNNQGAPAAGANSSTEGQAKSLIEAAGYTNVSALIKDKDGLWRGQASSVSLFN
jgi:hypothetical protein